MGEGAICWMYTLAELLTHFIMHHSPCMPKLPQLTNCLLSTTHAMATADIAYSHSQFTGLNTAKALAWVCTISVYGLASTCCATMSHLCTWWSCFFVSADYRKVFKYIHLGGDCKPKGPQNQLEQSWLVVSDTSNLVQAVGTPALRFESRQEQYLFVVAKPAQRWMHPTVNGGNPY